MISVTKSSHVNWIHRITGRGRKRNWSIEHTLVVLLPFRGQPGPEDDAESLARVSPRTANDSTYSGPVEDREGGRLGAVLAAAGVGGGCPRNQAAAGFSGSSRRSIVTPASGSSRRRRGMPVSGGPPVHPSLVSTGGRRDRSGHGGGTRWCQDWSGDGDESGIRGFLELTVNQRFNQNRRFDGSRKNETMSGD